MTVSRFTSFTKNFVICCYQVTKVSCSRYCIANGSSARSPCHLGLHADVAVSVLREVSANTVLARYHFFPRGSEADSREELAGASLCAGTLSSTRFSVNSSNHSGRSRNKSPRASSVSSFLSLSMLLVLSHRVVAGRNVETTESCGIDAGDVGVAELEESVDEPGTTIGT